MRLSVRLLSQLCTLALVMTAAFAAPVVSAQAVPVNNTSADPNSADSKAGAEWWSRVQYLAGDKLQGRLTGSAEYQQAAEYVAAQFKKDGLQPAGVNGYFQPVRFDVERVVAARSSLALVNNGHAQPLALGEDAVLSARSSQPAKLEAPLVFIGYGLHIPEAHYDDFAGPDQKGLDLRGKVVVYINGGPSDISAALKSDARGSEFAKALARSGAVGIISIPLPKAMDFPWDRIMLLASQTGMRLAADEPKHTGSALLSASFNPAEAEKLFAGSGHTFAEVLALANDSKPIPRFPLAVSLRASVVTENQQVESPNIVAELPGTDPVLKSEYVIVSAHLDHLGVGEPINGDKIYHGAMDDASGVAFVLEIARLMHADHVALKRSVLFAVFTAEEKGLLGSHYYATHPTVPKGSIAADINMDMPLPLYPFKQVLAPGLDESTLSTAVRKVAAAAHIQVVPDPEPDRNTFIRTDQYSFVRTGVPAVALKFGFEAGSPEQKTVVAWRKLRYHSTQDNLAQPVDLAAAAQFQQFVLTLTEQVANDPSRPQWKPESFFRRFANAGN